MNYIKELGYRDKTPLSNAKDSSFKLQHQEIERLASQEGGKWRKMGLVCEFHGRKWKGIGM